ERLAPARAALRPAGRVRGAPLAHHGPRLRVRRGRAARALELQGGRVLPEEPPRRSQGTTCGRGELKQDRSTRDDAGRSRVSTAVIEAKNVLGTDGSAEPLPSELSKEKLLEIYRLMVTLRAFDTRSLNLNRQGRIHFFAPSMGQEAAIVGS